MTKFSIGSRIRAHRLARGLTLQALADAAGISRVQLNVVELGTSTSRPNATPRVDTLVALARALGCAPADLIENAPIRWGPAVDVAAVLTADKNRRVARAREKVDHAKRALQRARKK